MSIPRRNPTLIPRRHAACIAARLPAVCTIIRLISAKRPSKPLSMAVAVGIVLIAAVGWQAYAADAPMSIRQGGELANQIQQELDHEACHERLWWNGWMIGYGAATVGQGVAAGLDSDPDTRADKGVGAATSFLGVLGVLISPLPEIDAAAKALRAMPTEGEEASRARDQAAITLREQAANVEREQRSWIPHILNFVVAGGSSLVLGLGFERGAGPAARNFGASFAVGELQIWTQPSGLINSPVPVAGASAEVPAAPQKSLRLAWNGQLLRLVLAF
jgi:hypothetical protein